MKILLLCFYLLLNWQCHSTQNELSMGIEEFYKLNKKTDFTNFKYWNIYPREGQKDTYIFDYIPENEIPLRFLIVKDENGVLRYKQIHPRNDLSFLELNDDINEKGFSLNLYLQFKSLNIKTLSYVNEYKMILFSFNSHSMIYSENEYNNLNHIVRFSNYEKIDPHWFFYKDPPR